MGGNGGPGAIRTPDPQIRRLHEGIENKQFSFKPTSEESLSKQRLKISTQTEKTRISAIRSFAKERHKRAARLLCYGLIIDTPEAWEAVSHLLAMRLSVGERAAILMAALHSLQPDQAAAICAFAFNGGEA